QYVGRLHRNYEGKKEVQIYDYVDVHIPVLERMYQKRLSTYHSLGYYVKDHIPMELETEKRIFTDEYQKELFDDFSNAKHHIVLSFHQANQEILHKLMNVLLGCYRNGVYVTVLYQKLDIEDEMMRYVEDSAYQGLRLLETEQTVSNLVVIDDAIVWYGSNSIFDKREAQLSFIHVIDNRLANEITTLIQDKITQERIGPSPHQE
ncbi:MAG: hypothetical protein ACRCZJ_04740, partial [Erysipelotrichaceae bacterium]